MQEVNVNFLDNLVKKRIDQHYLELVEEKRGVKFGRKYKEFLIKYYKRKVDKKTIYINSFFNKVIFAHNR